MTDENPEVADIERDGWTHSADADGSHRFERTDAQHYVEAIKLADEWVVQLRSDFDNADDTFHPGPIVPPKRVGISEGYVAVQQLMDESDRLLTNNTPATYIVAVEDLFRVEDADSREEAEQIVAERLGSDPHVAYDTRVVDIDDEGVNSVPDEPADRENSDTSSGHNGESEPLAVLVLDIPEAGIASGTKRLISQRIKEVVNSGDRLDDDDPRPLVNAVHWSDTESFAEVVENPRYRFG